MRLSALKSSAAGPVALLVASVALVAGAPRDGAAERVELSFAGVLETPDGSAAVLVLREPGTRVMLPVIVSAETGRALRASHRRTPGGPARGGLLAAAIAALGGRVLEVRLLHAEETPGAAVLRVARDGGVVELTGRPSEILPAAIAAGAPIVTARAVLAAEGLTPDDLGRARVALGATGAPLRL